MGGITKANEQYLSIIRVFTSRTALVYVPSKPVKVVFAHEYMGCFVLVEYINGNLYLET